MARANKRKAPKEILGVFYNQQDSFLYGVILFFKHSPGSEPIKPYDQSAPFVVAEVLGADDVIVHGSANYLVQDLRRLLDSIQKQLDEHNEAMSHLNPTNTVRGERAILMQLPDSERERREYFEFTRRLAGTLILISTQARNLFQMFPRLDRKIPLFDGGGNRTGEIALSDLFNHFVHNRYLFLNGEYVSDLFPHKPRQRAPIARKFMGYRINWIEYVHSVENAIRDVRLKDLTGLLRGRLKRLSLKSPYSDIVFLVQNLESFSRLFGAKAADGRYGSMLDLLLRDEVQGYLDTLKAEFKAGEQVDFIVEFNAPSVKIHEDLSEKKFKVYVRSRWILRGGDGQLIHDDQELRELTVEVGYERFLDLVNRVFGDDPVLDFRP